MSNIFSQLGDLTAEQLAAVSNFIDNGCKSAPTNGEFIDFGNNAEAKDLIIEIMRICDDNDGLLNALQILAGCVNGGGELVPARIVQQWKEDSEAFQRVKVTVMHRTQTVPVVAAPPPFTGPVPSGVTPASFATTPAPTDQPKKQSRRKRRANQSGDGPGGLVGMFSGSPRT